MTAGHIAAFVYLVVVAVLAYVIGRFHERWLTMRRVNRWRSR